MKNKLILKLLFIFSIILFIPILFIENLEFDYGIFFTQYYIFFLNTFLVIILGYYINNKVDNIKSIINKNSKKKKLIELLNKFYQIIKIKNEIELAQIYWERIKKIINEVDFDEILIDKDFNKINSFIKSLSSHNIKSKSETLEYKELLIYLKNIIKYISK